MLIIKGMTRQFLSTFISSLLKRFVTVLVVPVKLTRKDDTDCFPVFSKFDVTHIFSIEFKGGFSHCG